MDETDFAERIKNLTWEVDPAAGTCKCELAHYELLPWKTDLQMCWISPDVPASVAAINMLQSSAEAAFEKATKGA